MIRGNIVEIETFNTGIRVCKGEIQEETAVCTLHHLPFTVWFFFFFYLQLCLFSYFYSSLSFNHSSLSNRCAEQEYDSKILQAWFILGLQFLDEEKSCVFTESKAHILSRAIKIHSVLLEEGLCMDFTIFPSQFTTATVFKVILMEYLLRMCWFWLG